jgi:hypothetical protein
LFNASINKKSRDDTGTTGVSKQINAMTPFKASIEQQQKERPTEAVIKDNNIITHIIRKTGVTNAAPSRHKKKINNKADQRNDNTV